MQDSPDATRLIFDDLQRGGSGGDSSSSSGCREDMMRLVMQKMR
jgi:hypothetical protein